MPLKRVVNLTTCISVNNIAAMQAVVLAEYLSANPLLVRNKAVLELGAGTGLAGIVAARLGTVLRLN